MRQVVTVGPAAMEVREVPAPARDGGLATVRVEAVGLCGCDYRVFDGTHPYARFPLVQGREVAGRVTALPTGYRGDLVVGDRVAVQPSTGCGHCPGCRAGCPDRCPDLRVLGVQEPGGLADELAVPAGQLVATGGLPPLVAVLAEPVAVGLRGVTRGRVRPGDRIVVLGAGPLGLAVTLAARDRGAHVLVADRQPDRLEVARRLGATVAGTADLVPAVAGFAGRDGAAVVFEATGAPAMVRAAVDVASRAGTVVLVGTGAAADRRRRREPSVVAVRSGIAEFPAAVELVSRSADRLAHLVTHEFDLADAAKAVEYAGGHPHLVVKAVVTTGAHLDPGADPP